MAMDFLGEPTGGVFLSVTVRPDYPSPRRVAVSAQIEHIRRTGRRPNRRH